MVKDNIKSNLIGKQFDNARLCTIYISDIVLRFATRMRRRRGYKFSTGATLA